MKRERLEDLGRIYELIRSLLEDHSCPFDECTSKHSIDGFIEKYKDEEKLEDLHDWFRWKGEILREIYYLAKGDDE